MRILVIEDDADIAKLVASSLKAESFSIDIASDGERGAFLAKSNEYDLLIVDNALPKRSGLEVCAEVRAVGRTTPILILSAIGETTAKIDFLNKGADDYLTKPFSFEELLARIRALLRRPLALQDSILGLDDLSLDSNRHLVMRAEKRIYLTRKEFGLLEYLLKNKGFVVSRNMLLEHVWDMNSDPFSNTLEAHILNLRKKIETPFGSALIHTLPGHGYKIDVNK